jgi:hypothetical protein
MDPEANLAMDWRGLGTRQGRNHRAVQSDRITNGLAVAGADTGMLISRPRNAGGRALYRVTASHIKSTI